MKTETLEEFFARGGKIEVLPPQIPKYQDTIPVNSTGYEFGIMDLEEGSLYGTKASSLKNKNNPEREVKSNKHGVDLSKLPDHLKKYL